MLSPRKLYNPALKSQVYTTQEKEQFEISFQLQFVSYWKKNKQLYKLQWMHLNKFYCMIIIIFLSISVLIIIINQMTSDWSLA